MDLRFWKSPWFVVFCCTGVILAAYGGRQSMGMFVRPVTEALGWGEDVRALSLATGLQALIYGLSAPFVGAIADRWGPIKVLIGASLLYFVGLYSMSQSTTAEGFVISIGFISGIGSAGIALPILLSIAGRVVSEERRVLALGIVTSGATAGQMIIVPFTHSLIADHGWVSAVTVLATMVLLVVPLALGISHAASGTLGKKAAQSLGDAVREARSHRGFLLLGTGFFVCGFQVQFINNHLENYLNGTHVGGGMAATAISLIGFFNMLGIWAAGSLGTRFRKKYVLANIYTLRSLVFLAFFLIPVSEASVLIFACSVGFLWLATVPLTSGIVAQVFGPRYMATLYGVIFLSHQCGSFTSVYLGGVIRTYTGSYDIAWWMIICAGFVAALLHLLVDDDPVPRLVRERAETAT